MLMSILEQYSKFYKRSNYFHRYCNIRKYIESVMYKSELLFLQIFATLGYNKSTMINYDIIQRFLTYETKLWKLIGFVATHKYHSMYIKICNHNNI